MNKKANSENYSDVSTGGLSGASFHDGLFSDPKHAQSVLKAVRNFLKSSSGQNAACEFEMLGFAIEETDIEFSTKVKRIKMRTKYASGRLLLIAPMKENESEESLSKREAKILAEFSTRIYEGQMRSSLQFYRALDPEGRKVLIEEFGDESKKGDEVKK